MRHLLISAAFLALLLLPAVASMMYGFATPANPNLPPE